MINNALLSNKIPHASCNRWSTLNAMMPGIVIETLTKNAEIPRMLMKESVFDPFLGLAGSGLVRNICH
jgi:hypothetical protein